MELMKMMGITLASVLVSLPAYAQTMNSTSDNLTARNGTVPTRAGTVNDYSASWASEARHDALKAGYVPSVIEMAQARNIFFTATRNGQIYTVVVTPDEKVYASTPLSPRGLVASSG